MSSSVVLDAEHKVSSTIIRTLVVSFFAVILRIFQLVKFSNEETGMLNLSALSSAINVIVILAIIYIILEYAMLIMNLKKLIGYVRFKTQPMVGLSLVLVAVCFFIQGITDASSSFNAVVLNKMVPLISVFTVLSAVSYAVRGLGMVWNNVKSNFVLNIIPIIWCALVLMNVMLTYPVAVSMQSNVLKIICLLLVLLFMYYTASLACGYEKTKKSWIPILFQLIFPCVAIIIMLPHGIVYLFGIRDDLINIPYLAIIGLAVHGIMVMLQYMALSIVKLEKITSKKENE